IAFGAIVADAEHLAVGGRTVAALAPGGHVVGFHLVEVVDSRLVRVVAPPSLQRRTAGSSICSSPSSPASAWCTRPSSSSRVRRERRRPAPQPVLFAGHRYSELVKE